MSELLFFAHFLFFGERCEWITYFAQIKWAIRSGRLEEMSDCEQIAQVTHKNEQRSESLVFWMNRSFAHFWAKTSNSLRKPLSKFPALKIIDIKFFVIGPSIFWQMHVPENMQCPWEEKKSPSPRSGIVGPPVPGVVQLVPLPPHGLAPMPDYN